MSAKVTVAVIAQAAQDIETLRRPISNVLIPGPGSYADQAPQITSAFQRLERLVKELMGAEITVRGA